MIVECNGKLVFLRMQSKTENFLEYQEDGKSYYPSINKRPFYQNLNILDILKGCKFIGLVDNLIQDKKDDLIRLNISNVDISNFQSMLERYGRNDPQANQKWVLLERTNESNFIE